MSQTGDVLVVVPEVDYPGEALLDLKDAFDRHGVSVRVAAPRAGACLGQGGVTVTAVAIEGIDPTTLTAVVVLDGPGRSLAREARLRQLLQRSHQDGKPVCAIGHGIAALAAADLVRNAVVAADPHLADELRGLGVVPLFEPVVTHGNTVTATEAAAGALAEALVELRQMPLAPSAPAH